MYLAAFAFILLLAASAAMAVTTQTAAGGSSSYVIRADGSLWAWGNNFYGQVGDGTKINALAPEQIGINYTAVAAGTVHTLALKSDGSLWAWGSNKYSQLGVITTAEGCGLDPDSYYGCSTTPKQVGTGYAAVAAGRDHSVALKADGSLWAWGDNSYGQLGDPTTGGTNVPRRIGTSYTAVAAGYGHTVALKSDGSLWAWGDNSYGQLGDGTTTASPVPKQISIDYSAISAKGNVTVALKADGSLWAWGDNFYGQLGVVTDETCGNYARPCTRTAKLVGNAYMAVTTGGFHTVALKSDGSLWAWGQNNAGQLGDGTTTDSPVPKHVGAGYAAVAAGELHTVALKGDGSLWVWGNNSSGQLGDGTTTKSLVPKQIIFGETLAINGPTTLKGGSSGTYTLIRTHGLNPSETVTGTLGLGTTAYATLIGNTLTAGSVLNDQVVTLYGSYVDSQGVTWTATLPVTISKAVGVTLTGVSITGPASVNEGATGTYTLTASYADGSTATVTGTLSLASTSYATLAGSTLTAANVTNDQTVTLNASYTEGGVTTAASLSVTIKNSVNALIGIAINGPTSLAGGGGNATYSVAALYENGATATVASTLSSNDTSAVFIGNQLLASAVTSAKTVTLSASYTENGVTKTATLPVVITPSATATSKDVRSYIPAAMANPGYTSYVRVINTSVLATAVTVALIDGASGQVGTAAQLLAALPAGGAVTFGAQQIEAALGVSLPADARPRLRISAAVPIEVQAFQSNPTGVVVQNADALSGASSHYVPSYIPAGMAQYGYTGFIRIINTGTASTAIQVTLIDGDTGSAGASGELTAALPAGAARTFSAQEIEAALGVSVPADARPRMRITATVPIEVQSFQSNPTGVVTQNGGVRSGTAVMVQTYIPAALATSGYSSYVRIVNNGAQATPVSVYLIDPFTGKTRASGQLAAALAPNAAVTFSAQQIEAALGMVLEAQDRPRLLVTSPANDLGVQSFQSNPGGVVTQNAESRSGTSIDVRSYIPAASARYGYTSYLRFINTGSAATRVSVALINGDSGAVGATNQLFASFAPGAALTLSAAQIEAALGGPLPADARPRIRVTATLPIEVQSFQSSPTGVVTQNGSAQ